MTVSIMAVAVVGIVFLAMKLHGEAMKYVSEVQFYLNQKTVAFNRANASLSVCKSKMAEIEKRSVLLEKENLRLRKSLEVMTNKSSSSEANQVKSKNINIEKLEKEITSIQNVLNRDLKVQLKNYTRELGWLTTRLSEVQRELSQDEEVASNLADLSYDNAA